MKIIKNNAINSKFPLNITCDFCKSELELETFEYEDADTCSFNSHASDVVIKKSKLHEMKQLAYYVCPCCDQKNWIEDKLNLNKENKNESN